MPVLDLQELSRAVPGWSCGGHSPADASGDAGSCFELVEQRLSAMAQSNGTPAHEPPDKHEVFERAVERVLDVLLAQRREDKT